MPTPALAEAPLTSAERAMLDGLDGARRLALLRVMVPGLLAVALLALPAAIYADAHTGALASTAQVGVGVGAFAVAQVAVMRRRVHLAALAFFTGLAGVIVLLLLNDSALSGSLHLSVLPEFSLLALPIVVAGIFARARLVAFVTAATTTFTVLLVTFTPHAPDLQSTLDAGNGAVVFTVPIAAQLALAVLTIANARGQRRIQRELVTTRVAYEREKELDRLKDHFISHVNHELRTPIMALQSYMDVARELGARGDYPRQDHMLQRGQEAVEHLAGLVTSVLNVRRIEVDAASVKSRPFVLRPTALAAIHLLNPREAGEQPRDVRVDVPVELIAYADEDRTRQVLVNLLSNAVKYSAPGSPIELSVRIVRPQPSRRSSAPGLAAPMIEVAVRDRGLGIPPEQAPLLFQRFVRLERDIASNVTGTGLGLAICRAYVEAMGGTIWVESAGVPGEGSTFRFTLPLAELPGPAESPARPHTAHRP